MALGNRDERCGLRALAVPVVQLVLAQAHQRRVAVAVRPQQGVHKLPAAAAANQGNGRGGAECVHGECPSET